MNRIVTLSTIAATLAILNTAPAHAGTYQDAMRACGAEWRASEARTHVVKGEGAKAWNAFRATCTARVGWERKGKTSAPAAANTPSSTPPAAPMDPARAS